MTKKNTKSKGVFLTIINFDTYFKIRQQIQISPIGIFDTIGIFDNPKNDCRKLILSNFEIVEKYNSLQYVKSQPLTTQNTFQDLMDLNPEIKGRNIEIEDASVEMESDSKIRKVKEPSQAPYFKKSKPSQENQSTCI